MAEQAANADVLIRGGRPATNGWLRIITNFCRRNPMGAISGVIIIAIVLIAIFPRWWPCTIRLWMTILRPFVNRPVRRIGWEPITSGGICIAALSTVPAYHCL